MYSLAVSRFCYVGLEKERASICLSRDTRFTAESPKGETKTRLEESPTDLGESLFTRTRGISVKMSLAKLFIRSMDAHDTMERRDS